MIGSQALIAEPRLTAPPATAAARARTSCAASDTAAPFTIVVAAVVAHAPTGACAEAIPSRSTSSGSSSGRRNRSTAGYLRPRPARFDSRTEHPVITTRSAGFAAFSRARWPWRPITFASAASRMAQVLMTTRSAASIDGASGHPAARSRPAISSESLRFIWQPSVHTKNDGRDRISGRNSARRRSSGTSASRGRPAGAPGATRSRTGSGRGVMRARS